MASEQGLTSHHEMTHPAEGTFMDQRSTPSKSKKYNQMPQKYESDLPVFSYDNQYTLLEDLSLEDPQVNDFDYTTSTVLAEGPRRPANTMMPYGDSPFWQIYGNNLRVNGTMEEVCQIW